MTLIIAQLSAANVLLQTLFIFLLCQLNVQHFPVFDTINIMKPHCELPSFRLAKAASQKTNNVELFGSNFENLMVRGFFLTNLTVLFTILRSDIFPVVTELLAKHVE